MLCSTNTPVPVRCAFIYQTLIQHANLQFDIVLRTINFDRKSDLFVYRSPEERFGGKTTFVAKDETHLTESDIVYGKIKEDALAVYQLFLDIANELQESRTYNILTQSLANIRNKQIDDYKILNYNTEKEYNVLHRKILDINKKLKSYKQQHYYLQIAGSAEDAVITRQILCETGYLTRWMKAQLEMQKIVSKSLVSKIKKNINLDEHFQTQEDGIHLEIRSFYEYSIESLQEGINSWDLKRDKDEANLMRKNQEMRQRRDEMKDQIIALQQIYDKRKKQIDDYLHYKKIKQEELEEQRLREIENEEINLLEIEKRKLKEQELLRKKYLSKEKKKRRKA